MSKTSRSKRKKTHAPAIPQLSVLRPRLDQLLQQENLVEQDAATIQAELNRLIADLEPEAFLPVVVRACVEASEPVWQRVDKVLPEWLQQQGYIEHLLTLLERRRLHGESSHHACRWLARAGVEDERVRRREQIAESDFYRGYYYGDGSQGLAAVLWYTDVKRSKIQGLTFLIDYNPPWDGCIKDVARLPTRSEQRIGQDFIDVWRQRGMDLVQLDAAEIKQRIVECLAVNRRENIRLPRDLIVVRSLFAEQVLSLPDIPGTLRFNLPDFDDLAHQGEAPEKIRQYEQRVGRRVRLDSGQEVLVMGDPWDERE